MTTKGNILVVEDNHASLKLLTDTLTAEGYQARPADSGELALASVVAKPPELILLDIHLPGIDGFEVLRRLKARPESRDIPIIFLSASVEMEQQVEGLKLGAVDFIAKPFQRDELLARVQTHLELFRLRARLEQQASELRRANEQLQREIAERTQTEEALKESEEKYRLVVENASEAIYVVQQGVIVFANAVVARAAGVSPAELVGRAMTDFVPEEERSQRLAYHLGILSAEVPTGQREIRISLPGRERWLLLNNVLVQWNGQAAVLCFATDITARKQAEEALRESEAKFRGTIEQASDGILICDEQGRIVEWNASQGVIFGLPREKMIGTMLWDFQFAQLPEGMRNEESYQRLKQAIQNMGQAEGATWMSRIREMEVVSADGQRRDVQVSAFAINTQRGQLYASITHDITERKRAEEARLELERRLLRSQRLESLGVLAGGIAHDFNNLLAVMLGNLDMALLELSPVSLARSSIEEAARAAQRAADLTRQMLAYSGKGHFVISAINLNDLLAENAHMLRSAISKMATLNLQLGRSLPTVQADVGQMQQIVMNLLSNASEAIGERPGAVTLSTGAQECDAAYLSRSRLEEKPAPGRYAWLEVSDTGCGMDEETQRRMFEPFFSTKFTGRGLGLAAVLGIVRGHQGAILVDSVLGQGTTVRVLFPAAVLPAAPVEGAVAEPRAAAALSGAILVVDDEAPVRAICQRAVQRFGFRALGAGDGAEALRVYRAHAAEIVCVILDLTMPKMDGAAAFAALQAINPQVKAILCSGYDERSATERFAGQGLAGFLQKPYRLEALRVALEQALG